MKKRSKSFSMRSIAMFLTLAMVFQLLPLSAFAAGNDADSYNDNSYERLSEVFEVESLREENVKHFRLEDGTYIAAQYTVPVHYLDENGEWQNIDNSLVSSGSEYSTSDAKIKFAKKITGNENMFTIHDGNYKITMGLDNAIKKTTGKVVESKTKVAENASKLQKMMTLDNLTSEIIYEDILSGVDLQYIVETGSIKENLIVKTRQDSYGYDFTLKLNNLKAVLNENGSVSIVDPDSSEIIYYIPAPVVYDANDTIADSALAHYTLTQSGNNSYTLTVSVDKDWMNDEDRAYPVTIDPPIYPKTGTPVVDTYVNSYSPTQAPELVSHLYAGNTTHLYWKSKELPKLPNDAYITGADFSLQIIYVPEGTYNSYMGIFQVTSDWDESLCWNDYASSSPKGDFDPDSYTDFNVVSVVDDETDSEWLTWDVTSIVKNWYSGQPNYGITVSDIRGGTESYSARNIKFHSNGSVMASRPKLCITYKDMKGVEDYWTTTSQNAGLAGTGHVNNATGDLVFMIGTLTSTDSLMPYTPTLTYNSAIADYPGTYQNTEVPYLISSAGFGFKWSMYESIVERTYYGSGNTNVTYYVWSDADGTEHYFTPCLDASGNTIYKDEDGLQLTLTVGTSSYTITDTSNTVRTFTRTTSDSSTLKAGGVLSKITDASGNCISFNPNEWGRTPSITLIPKGSSEIASFKVTYNANAKINRILNTVTQDAVLFYYSSTYNGTDISLFNNGYLRKIVYAHQTGSTSASNWSDFMQNGSNDYITVDAVATYSYDSSGRLITARDGLSGYEVNYGYTNGKVTSITEKAGKSSLTTGQQILMSYYDSYTEVRTSGKDDIINTDDDIITRYVFDNSGRTITAYSMDVMGTTIYGATSGQYNDQSESKNSIRVSSYVSDSAANYLLNGGFEDSTAMRYWYYTAGKVEKTAAAKYAGNYGATLSATSGQTTSIYQYVNLTKGSYTLSFNINTNNCKDATVRAVVRSSSRTYTENISVDEASASGAYGFASLNFDVTASSDVYQVIIQIVGTSSTAQSIMVDNVMLAKSVGVSSYSMVNFGNFENCSLTPAGATRFTPNDVWSRSDTTNVTFATADVEGDRFGQSLKIVGSLDSARSASTSIFKASSSTDLATPKIYKISGFAKANKQMSNTSSRFALKVDITYYNESEPKTYWFDFANTPADQWQFVSGTFDVCSDGGAVKDITVSCVYDYQSGLGTAYFDNITVVEVKDGSAESYTYYDNGMPKTYDNGGYQEWYYYADNNTSTNLTKKITSTKGITEYTYDSKNRIIQEVYYEYTGTFAGNESEITITPRTKTTYVYNNYGLITNTTVKTVRYSGTSLVDTVPANVISSDKTYNTTAGCRYFGALATETDTLGQITRYFYDSSSGRLKAVINPDQTSGLVYSYDRLGNITLVEPATYSSSGVTSVTNAESAAYTYENGRLSTITTGSSTFKFTYDVFGNNTGIDVGDRDLADYTYNSRNGKLSKITYGNGFVVNYVYDELDRIQSIKYNNTVAYQYEYDANGNLCKLIDKTGNRTYQYKYDDQGRLTGFYESISGTNNTSATNIYDEQNRLHLVSYSKDYALTSSSANLTTSYKYDYTDKGNLSKLTMTSGNATYTYTPSYDALDRVYTSAAVMSTASGSLTNTITYDFTVGSNSNESLQVSDYTSQFGSNKTSYAYTYDANGNITKITLSTGAEYRYVYDDIGQLIREDNTSLSRTYVYTYDNAGNILTKKTYALTAAGSTPSTLYSTYSYGYTDSWGDLLTSYRGVSFTYDEVGNPLTYYNGSSYTFTWENGRQMKTATVGSNTLSFTYNHDGIRTSKTVNGVVHNYTVSGSLILTEEWGTNLVVYLYDNNGAPIGMRYRTSSMAEGVFYTFWFERNLQGDVVAVYNETGTKVRSYTYDAWGNKTTTIHNSSGTNSYAQYNAITYRGYYFDSETNLYYVSSRYYDAKIGRFVNADDPEALNAELENIVQDNLFAYCFNSPINRMDDTGAWPKWATKVVIGTAVIAAAAVLTVATGGVGMVGCFAAGALKGAAIGAAVGATTGAATGAAKHRITTGSWNGAGQAALNGAADGYMTGAISGFVSGGLTSKSCFVAGTAVLTSTGSVAIETVCVGDYVWAWDEETGDVALKKVVETYVNETSELIHVFVNDEEIITTPSHPFYSPVKGWTSAVDLRAGDILVLVNGEYVVVEKIQHEILESPIAVYNFQVEDYHTYYVAGGVLVHNNCRGTAVKKAWKNEQNLVRTTGKGTREWTSSQMTELLNTGKVKGFVGHHMKSVKGFPSLAGDPNNIQFLTRTEHLLAHGGNWRNITYGRYIG